MSKPRILHISTANSWRGGEQQLAYLLEELSSDTEQHVICNPNSPMEAKCKALNIPFTSVSKKSGFDLGLAKRLKGLAASLNSQLVHTHDAHGHTAAILASRLFGMRVPLVIHRRVDFHIHSSFSKRFKYQYKGIAKIICVSKAIEDIMAYDLGTREKLITIHSGIDTSRFAQSEKKKLIDLGIPEGKAIVGNVAAHAPHKDLFTFIRTAKRICEIRDDVHFVSVGDGPISAEIKSFCNSEGLNDKVSFLGYRTDVPSLLPCFDVFLMTSETEGLGTSVLDAMAAQIPVVATRAGGIPEMIIDEKTGLLADVKDDLGLSKAVIKILNYGGDLLVQNASKKLKAFTKKSTATKTLSLYQELLGF